MCITHLLLFNRLFDKVLISLAKKNNYVMSYCGVISTAIMLDYSLQITYQPNVSTIIWLSLSICGLGCFEVQCNRNLNSEGDSILTVALSL